MNVSKADAGTKVCPLRGGKCISDGCMGWRWTDMEHDYVRAAPRVRPEGTGWVKAFMRDGLQIWKRPKHEARRGYCGAVAGEVRIEPIYAEPLIKSVRAAS